MSDAPFVTVLMPVRNEAGFISRSLGAVLQQDYPQDRMEIIVADGMSTDGTRDIIKTLQTQHSRLRLIDNPGKIAPTGLNAATLQARGEIIVRVDGHCEIERNYVRRSVEHLQHDGVDAVGGPLETVGETPFAQIVAVAMSSAFGVGGAAFRTISDRTMLTDTVAFPAYKRSIIERAGPYDEELVRNQDDEYNYRLRELGAKILLAADVRSRYYSRTDLRSAARQYFQYGYWKVRVMQKHPRQMRVRHFVPPLFVGGLLVSVAASLFSAVALWLFVLAAGCYLLANATASIVTARHRGVEQPMLLFTAVATIHIAYGYGFLHGLIRFRRRWGDRETRLIHPGAGHAQAQCEVQGAVVDGRE
jgi:succinoglycan biosynthesis protein ExoA